MLRLPQVTLIALTGIGYKTLEHAKALDESCKKIEFGSVKLIQLSKITDINSWNKAVIYDLWKHVKSEFALFIHHDGYVINPELWRDEWLQWDYIGAPWPLPQDEYSYKTPEGKIVRVGNSVSLRSSMILKIPFEFSLPWQQYYGNYNEDGFLCVHNRKRLEELGVKFAPLEVAKYFSKEHEIPENKDLQTFMFHQI